MPSTPETGPGDSGSADSVMAVEAGPGVGDASTATSSGPKPRSLADLVHSTTSTDWQIARNMIETKVVDGKASRTEISLLLEICENQRDKLCQKEARKQLKLATH
jgi:hypothetical protein